METTARIAHLLQRGKPFAAWRMPKENKVQLLEGGLRMFDPEAGMEGFVFHPFDTGQNPVLIITGEDQQNELGVLPVENIGNTAPVVDFEQYSEQVRLAVHAIRQGKLQKIVLSRMMEFPGLSSPKAASSFEALCGRFPDAFVYLFSAGIHTRWMGASPETLVKFDGNQGYTMSLAGTLPLEGSHEWSEKERVEQQIVTDYIVGELHRAGVSEVRTGQPFVSKAGNLLHLKTEIRFLLPDKHHRYAVLKALHPTPAVCGSPKEAAMQLIGTIEPHRRAYYTGFLGPWATKGPAHLFVNLRCMAFSEQRSYIFVGGGLTADSVAEREWAETTWKAGTLSWLFEAK